MAAANSAKNHLQREVPSPNATPSTHHKAALIQRRLERVLRQVHVERCVPPTLALSVVQSLEEFVAKHRPRDDGDSSNTTLKRSHDELLEDTNDGNTMEASTATTANTEDACSLLATTAFRTAESLCQLAMGGKNNATTAATTGSQGLAIRRSLEQASAQLLQAVAAAPVDLLHPPQSPSGNDPQQAKGPTTGTKMKKKKGSAGAPIQLVPPTETGVVSAVTVGMTLALLDPPSLVVPSSLATSDNNGDQGGAGKLSRAAASAMASVLQRSWKANVQSLGGRQRDDRKLLAPACCILEAFLMDTVAQHPNSSKNSEPPLLCDKEGIFQVDWHIVTSLARALGMDGSSATTASSTGERNDTHEAVAKIVSELLGLDLTAKGDDASEDVDDDAVYEPPSSHDDSDKTRVAAALALAAQLRPWSVLSPSQLVRVAVPQYDLWHAVERVCDSAVAAADDGNQACSATAAAAAIDTLIQTAMDAKTYRRADTFATKFYHAGGKVHYLSARLYHACDTVAKVVRKGRVLPVIERQIDRVDKAAAKIVLDGVVVANGGCDDSSSTSQIADAAKEEIRMFALRQLEEAGDLDAAHRLASIYELDYVYDEEALAAALEARRQKYLQWEEVLPGQSGRSLPELVSTPQALLEAFQGKEGGKGTRIYGFDVEWSDDDAGADLLQVAIMSTGTVVLIDIPALSMTSEGADALEQTVGQLFASVQSQVIGFGCRQDLSRLRSSPCSRKQHWFSDTNSSVIDLQKLLVERDSSLRGLGLSRVSELYLGKPLDKSEQCSFWAARPLSPQQRVYAALDAWVCVAVHMKLFPEHVPSSVGQ